MKRKITIDPVTRVEGHGKVTIHLDDKGVVDEAYFHIVEFRGFEKFIQGHPYWEAPLLVQRLCGICPVSHHLAASKAIDQLVGVDPKDLKPAATLLRRLLHYGQVLQSHALHFFYLASPDLLFGKETPASERNVIQVIAQNRELAKKGILIRKFGQEIIKAIAGRKIHGIVSVPGGNHKTFTADERDMFLKGIGGIPDVYTIIDWCRSTLDLIKDYHRNNSPWVDEFAAFPSGHLSLVGSEGQLELYNGELRAIDPDGRQTLHIQDVDYASSFSEQVQPWTYLKFPFLAHLGPEKGWNRVGPLARLNVCSFIPTPLAEQERQIFFAGSGSWPNNKTMHTHWARLIEMLHCAEVIGEMLQDDRLLDTDLRTDGSPRREGIGVIEAPRGTLIHHYLVDGNGKIERCNLIVSTTHNNEAMNRAVRWVAKKELSNRLEITEPMLNQVEVAIRAYDPCLSCATHALGQMPLSVSLFDHQGKLIHERHTE